MERPRDGGAAISCSQMASRHFSMSACAVGGAADSEPDFGGLATVTEDFMAVEGALSAGSPIPARSSGGALADAACVAPGLISGILGGIAGFALSDDLM